MDPKSKDTEISPESQSPLAQGGTTDVVVQLKQELHETQVKHQEELYWVRLELDKARRDQEAAEERWVDLLDSSRDALSDDSPPERDPSQTSVGPPDIAALEKSLLKNQRMVGVLMQQVKMVRHSSDRVVQSLQAEIADLVDEKCRAEVSLMNQVTQLEAQLRQNQEQLRQSRISTIEGVSLSGGNPEDPEEVRARMIRLAIDNTKLKKQLEVESFKLDRANIDKMELNDKIGKLEGDILLLRSSAAESLVDPDDDIEANLDRTLSLWKQADSTIENIESILLDAKKILGSGKVDEVVVERFQSTLERASLLEGEIKVSLMHIETKLRNRLNRAVWSNGDVDSGDHEPFVGSSEDNDRLNSRKEGLTMASVLRETMASIDGLGQSLSRDMKKLNSRAENDARQAKARQEELVATIEILRDRQNQLASRLASALVQQQPKEEEKKEEGTALVSGPVMDQLQHEVLQVVRLLQEKNAKIFKLQEKLNKKSKRMKKVSPRKQDTGSVQRPEALKAHSSTTKDVVDSQQENTTSIQEGTV